MALLVVPSNLACSGIVSYVDCALHVHYSRYISESSPPPSRLDGQSVVLGFHSVENELVPEQPFVPSFLDCSQTQCLVLFFHLVFLALLRCLHSVPVCSSAAFSCLLQGGARTDARQAPWARGDARRNGPHPHRHTCGGTAPPGSVEAATPSLLQCKFPPQLHVSVEGCPPFADEESVPGFPVVRCCDSVVFPARGGF